MENKIERYILRGLMYDEDYTQRVLPYIHEEYFQENNLRWIFRFLRQFAQDWQKCSHSAPLFVELANDSTLSERERGAIQAYIKELKEDKATVNKDWLFKQTEQFCKQRAIYNAIADAITIYEDDSRRDEITVVPENLRQAISVSFDNHIGMDYIEDAERRYDYYSSPVHKIEFDLHKLNQITNGGVTRKTLNLIVAGVNVGKTLGLIHLACSYVRRGLNVLYISMEMREEEILKRCDANMMDKPIFEIETMRREQFVDAITKLKMKSYGKLKVKEFPPGCATCADFERILMELKLKNDFSADIVIVDYIGLVAPIGKGDKNKNSYFALKATAEEMRALSVKHNCVVWTAMQLTREGFDSNDVEMTDIAESFGVPATADFIISITRDENMDKQNRLKVKQLKNRYGNRTDELRFDVGVDLKKQTLYDYSSPDTQTLKDKLRVNTSRLLQE